MTFISNNLTAFIILFGLIAFFIIRDIYNAILDNKAIKKHKEILATTESNIASLINRLDADRNQFMEDISDLDKKYPGVSIVPDEEEQKPEETST
jgi:hypothetical protein